MRDLTRERKRTEYLAAAVLQRALSCYMRGLRAKERAVERVLDFLRYDVCIAVIIVRRDMISMTGQRR